MGIGNMSRRLGMNRVSARKTAKEAAKEASPAVEGGFPPSGGPENGWMPEEAPRPTRRSNEVMVVDVTQGVEDLVSEFADVEARLKELNDRRAELKARAIEMAAEHQLDDLVGTQGKVQVIKKKASVTFDKKLAKTFMTEDQWGRCQKTGKEPDPAVKFVPPKED